MACERVKRTYFNSSCLHHGFDSPTFSTGTSYLTIFLLLLTVSLTKGFRTVQFLDCVCGFYLSFLLQSRLVRRDGCDIR